MKVRETINQTYLFNSGELVYFGSEHLPFGVLAVLMLTLFNILPMVLLFLYPCGWFLKCLSYCGINSHALHAFMDAFQSCYRHRPRDCRYFAAVYLLFRFLNILSSVFFIHEASIAVSSFIFIVMTMSLVIIAPYREEANNKIDTFFILLLLLCFPLSYLDSFPRSYFRQYKRFFKIILIIVSVTPVIYGLTLFLRKVLPRKMQVTIKGYLSNCMRCAAEQDMGDDVHLYRFETEYSPLLP